MQTAQHSALISISHCAMYIPTKVSGCVACKRAALSDVRLRQKWLYVDSEHDVICVTKYKRFRRSGGQA